MFTECPMGDATDSTHSLIFGILHQTGPISVLILCVCGSKCTFPSLSCLAPERLPSMDSISGLFCLQSGSGQRRASTGDPRVGAEVTPSHCCSSQVLVISLVLWSFRVAYLVFLFFPIFTKFSQLLWETVALLFEAPQLIDHWWSCQPAVQWALPLDP